MKDKVWKVIIREIIEWSKVIGVSVIASLLITRFVFAHTVVPTGSMYPTIKIQDHLIANKVSMYFRDPERGEVVVFHGEKVDLVKRVIGLPGETIDMHEGQVYINGELLDEAYLPAGIVTSTYPQIIYPYQIPEGQYFVMGDNREDSTDSRVIGTVTREKIYATARLRVWPLDTVGNIY